MVSKNNAKMVQQKMADQRQKFGIRKLSIGVASVLLGTVFYLQSGTVYADVNPTASTGNDSINVVNENSDASSSAVGSSTSNSTGSSNSVSSAGDATNSIDTRQVSASSVESATGQTNNNAVAAGNEQGSSVPTSHGNAGADKNVKNENSNVDSHPAQVPNSYVALETSMAGSGRVDSRGEAPFRPVLAMKAETEAPVAKPAVDSEAPKRETVDSKWIIHYVNQADHKQELKDPTVITMQYARTNTPQSDGKTQYGDWSYVPGSFKQTGTAITVNDSDNPVKQDNIDKNGENFDVFTITAMYPTVAGYGFYNGINGTRLHDNLLNDDRQADSMSKDFYAEYDVAKERSVSVKFVDDQSFDPNVSGGKAQVGQTTTLTGRDGDTVKVNVTVPDKYQLANGQQLPTTYTFTAGSGDVTIHLVHKVVQREATIDVPLVLITLVRTRGDDGGDDVQAVVTQTRWKQLEEQFGDEIKYAFGGSGGMFEALPSVEVGTLTGHVDYDLVDETVVSLKNDWTSLNLSGHSYELPNGTEVVNGIRIDASDTIGKKLRDDWYLNEYRKWQSDVDPDYITRPWYGYLSVNETNNESNSDFGIMGDVRELGLQAGLVGDEPNALAKAIGDRAATSVEMANKTIDPNWLKGNGYRFDFSEQDGQLRAKALLLVAGVYIPYVEKIATRTIKVTTPDGKTKTVKQTATLAKQVDFRKDAHPAWTTGEWTNYDVPTIPGYTASQTSVAKETVTGETKDQTVDVTYIANPQTTHVNYVDAQGKLIHATTINGKTGQTVKVSSEIPDGWKLVDGQTVPSTITFGPDGHADMPVKIEHRHVTVTPDKPQANGTELPDNPKQSFHGVEASDLNKTVTRMIKVSTPTGKTNTIKQEAKLTRTATIDEVTGDVSYGGWSIGQWDAYQVPSLNGYTATQPEVAATSVNENTTNQTVDVSYTPNKQSTVVKYVDDNNQVVHTTTVNGVTDQTVKVPNEVPAGWMITNGNVPSKITFGADGHEAIEVTVEHQHVTVDPTDPKNPTDTLPDNSAKNYPAGVSESDLNKTITRTIKITQPDGTATNKVQTVKLTRTADVDEVTGEVTYGKWTTGQWDAYEIPSAKGYTASQASVAAMSVTSDTKDQTVKVSYTANKQSTVVKYVDDKGQVIYTTTVNGVTDQTVKVPSEVPAGWMITNGKVPNEITFGVDGHEPIEVTVDHRHVTVDPAHPQTNGTKLPDNLAKTFNGVEANDLNKTITRTIEVTTPDGKSTTTKQIAKLTRTADVDEVTGEVTYGNWTTGEWTAYDVPSVAGYTPGQTAVAKESVTATSNDTTVEITYLPMQHQISVEYVDDDDHGKIVKTDQVPGKTDQTITVTPSAPANYDLVDNGNRTYTVTSDDAQAVQIHVKHHQVTTSESKTVTRTINVHTPHDGVKTVTQTVELNRDVTTDQVTGEKTYSDWTTGQWKSYTPEAIPGYAPSTNEVPTANVDGSSTDQTVDVTYTANAQHVDIVYVDDAKDGAAVKTDQVAGETDETVKVTPNVPTGYQVVGEVPGSYTMTADGHQAITVHLVHQMKTASESKAVTRTINVNTPHDGTTVFKQTVDLSRDVTTDQVTGDKTYGDWSTTEWTHYDVPVVAGYTPSIKQVAQQVVDGTTKDQTVDVTYTANIQTTHVNYVDGDDNVVHTTTITGKTDQTVKVPNETPAGWKVVGESVPTEITFGPDGHADVTVTVGHQHVTVTPDDPKTPADKLPNNPGKTYPAGVGHDDLNKTVTRIVKVTTPDGKTQTTVQKVQLTRTADVDEVTDEVIYGNWTTGEWANCNVPTVPGYTASQSEVPATKVTSDTKNQTVTVTYTANAQTTTISYVDQNGKTVHTTVVNGHTDQTVKVPNETPAGWTITKGQVPTEITFGPNGHDRVTVTVDHKHVAVTPDKPQTDGTKLPDNPSKTFHGVGHSDLNKTIVRTIEVTAPTGKTDTIKQTVKLTRSADVDEVTGEVTYSKWTTGAWSSYNAPAMPGYTPSQAVVAEAAVNADTTNQTVKINYMANAQTTHINYVDENGEVVHTTTIKGYTDQTVKVPNETPAGWTVTAGQVPSEVAFGPDGNPDVTVTVDHQHVTVTPEQSKVTTDKLPDNPAKTYPNGVGHDDLNKAITRTIKVTTPDGQTKTVAQKVQLTRTADVDEVTGEVTYVKWTTGEWSSYEVPVAPGYTASQNEVPAVKVTDDTKDQTVAVTYTANDQTTHINYVDGNGKIVNTKTITGKTDQTVKVPNEAPTGWTITNGQVPSEVIFGANGYDDVTVTVDHQHVTVTPDKPKTNGTQLPDDSRKTFYGVAETDLNKVVTRTIEVTSPDQKTTTVKQTTKLARTADVDEVTGEVTYGKWATGSWSSYTVPTVAGYTPSQAVANEVAVDANTADQTVKITYTADSHTTHINYVDKDGNVVHTTTVTGATDQTVKVPNEVPADWKVTGESMPTELTFGPDGHADVTVTVDHQHVMMTPDKPRENDTKLSNTISKAIQSTQTASQNISIRTSQTSTSQTTNKDHERQLPQATNNVHESQLPQTGNKTDSKLELIGLIGVAFAGLTGLFGFGTSRKKRD